MFRMITLPVKVTRIPVSWLLVTLLESRTLRDPVTWMPASEPAVPLLLQLFLAIAQSLTALIPLRALDRRVQSSMVLPSPALMPCRVLPKLVQFRIRAF